jgi:hypothetical protein
MSATVTVAGVATSLLDGEITCNPLDENLICKHLMTPKSSPVTRQSCLYHLSLSNITVFFTTKLYRICNVVYFPIR